MEGADDGRAGAERRVPADQRHQRLVDVDDVVVAPAQLPAQLDDAAGGNGERLETAPLAPKPTVRPSGIR